jgi:hypothetical protein
VGVGVMVAGGGGVEPIPPPPPPPPPHAARASASPMAVDARHPLFIAKLPDKPLILNDFPR